MPVSYIPSGQNTLQEANIDPGQLVQLALAVKQSKLAEKNQQYSQSLDALKMLTENPQLMETTDPKMLEKHLKNVGLDPASADQSAALQKLIEGGGAPPAPAPSAPVPGNQLEQLGATMQGSKAGAQSATPPSSNAANKAPGGGVTPGGIVTPGTGQLQQLQGQGMKNFTDKVGSLAPIYMGAAAQQQRQFMIAKEQQRLGALHDEVAGGGPGAVAAQAQLYAAAGQHITEADMTALLTNNKDPKVAAEAMNYALHNESGEKQAARYSDTLKTLGSDSSFMGKLKDPTDLPRIVDSIVQGHGMPSDVLKRPMSLNEIKDANAFQKQLVDQGFDPTSASTAADLRAQGIPYTMSLPSAMHGMTIPQQEAGAKVETGRGMLLRGEAAMKEAGINEEKLSLEHDKITKSLDEQLKMKLENMLALQKGGVKIPQPMLDENLAKVAEQSGVSVERVSHWYNWLYLGSQLEGKGVASKTALAGQGGDQDSDIPKPVASPRLSHSRNVTPDEARRIRSMVGR